MITETQCSKGDFPKVKGYFMFFRNRKNRKGGGVAILIADDLKSRATLLESGKDQCEMIAIKLGGYVNPVMLVCYYSQQENTTDRDVIDDQIGQVVSTITEATLRGEPGIAAGDFNLRTGDKLTPNPNKNVSWGG